MDKITPWSQCTAQMPSGRFCQSPAIPLAPFPICIDHAARLYRYLNETYSEQPPMFDPEVERPAKEYGKRTFGKRVPRPTDQTTIYYLRVGSLVKIGRTMDLRSRLADYPPDSRLLAIELGPVSREYERHFQFINDLEYGKEWFRPSPALIEHINTLRSKPLTASDLAA